MITPSFGLTATERVLPKLALDFTTASLDSRVTFTRTTNATNPATYTNSSGYVTSATNDQPRFDYDSVTLACKGLLIEESRANILLYSEQLQVANYTKTRITVSADAATAPDNTLTADKIIPSTVSGDHFVEQYIGVVSSGVTYTFSFYIKPAGYNWCRVSFGNTAGGGVVFFDVANGVAGPGGGMDSYGIQNAGNGWYRCYATKTTTTSGGLGAAIYAQSAGPQYGWSGNGTDGLYVWGTQLEIGAFPTSYIPTTTTALTRNADVATMTGTNFSSWYNATQGAFSVTFNDPQSGIGGSYYPGVCAFSDNTNNNRMILYRNAGSNYSCAVTTSGVSQANLAASSISTNQRHSVVAYKLDSFAAAGEGGNVSTDNSGTVPSVNRFYIGCDATGNTQICGTIAKVLYYPQRLINAEVQAFSK